MNNFRIQMILLYPFIFIILIMQASISFGGTCLQGTKTSSSGKGIHLNKFVRSNAPNGVTSYSGFLSIDNTENKPEAIEKIFKYNFGDSGIALDWEIAHRGCKSYVTMLPTLENDDMGPLLFNSAFLSMVFQNEDNLEKGIFHKDSSLHIIKEYEPIKAFMKEKPDITLDNYDIAVLERTNPDLNIKERIDELITTDYTNNTTLLNSKDCYKHIVARKKGEDGTISFATLMTGMYSYVINRSHHSIDHTKIAEINITNQNPKFNMLDNIHTVRQQLKEIDDPMHPPPFDREYPDNKLSHKDFLGIDQKYFISLILDWQHQ